jgi:hypothetical protein
VRLKLAWIILLALAVGSCTPASATRPVASATASIVVPTPTSNPTPIPAATHAPTSTPFPESSIAYYRLRLEYSTSSDWATLEFEGHANILSMRVMETSGDPTQVNASSPYLGLTQSLDAALQGHRVGITIDYAISSEDLPQTLPLTLGKGDIGECTLRVYVLVGGQPQLLSEITHRGVVPNSEGLNPRQVQIPLGELRMLPPLGAQIERATPKMLLAFYYPWYRQADWSSPLLKDHPQTRYSSADPQAIDHQIEQAQQVGIDGFISSWWGPGDYTDHNLETLLRLAEARGFAVSIYFETLKDDGPRDEAEILRWLAYAISRYGNHPAFLRVNGRPVIMLWASGAVPLDTWQNVFSQLRARGLDAVFLGMGYDVANLAVFDGVHEYGIFTIPNLAEVYQSTARATRYYSLLFEQPTLKFFAAAVQPGYDDRLIPGREGLFQDRQDGEYYRTTFEAALQSDPDWIFITTWNEWWEHTHIEPSELYGELYLEITRQYAERWKGNPPSEQ